MYTRHKPRRWFQLHLSTCLVLMVVAGMVTWLNVLPYPDGHYLTNYFPPIGETTASEYWCQGWPAPYGTFARGSAALGKWYFPELLLDAVTGLSLLITAGFLVEKAPRWRARRRLTARP